MEAGRQKRRRLNDEHRRHSQTTATATASTHTYSTYESLNHNHDEYSQVSYVGNSCHIEQWPSSESWGEEAAGDVELSGYPSDCCYGMLPLIPVRIKRARQDAIPQTKSLRVAFESPNTLRQSTGNEAVVLEIECSKTAQVLSELKLAEGISTQLYCQTRPVLRHAPSVKSNSKRRARAEQSWTLSIIIYGDSTLGDPIGDYLAQRQMYLQDPLGCDRSVPYRNPHIIQPESGEVIMTDSFESSSNHLGVERLDVAPDLLAQLMQDEKPFPETEPPKDIVTRLFSHQKQALTFMLRREQGWAMEDGSGDIWTKQNTRFGGLSFLNNVTGAHQDETPPCFQGGLLADDMGLGKTLSMISLIVSNQAEYSLSSLPKTPHWDHDIYKIKTTLLVVPPPLIQAWQKQFSLHTRPDSLKVHVFHGNNRKSVEFLSHCDIVITTFHTVSAIWRNQNEAQHDPESIFSVIWHRIVLDEAHTIQNAHSQLAKSCCALRSANRWAITGTPIQNKLTDFASIVRFLGAYPYSEQSTFDEHISRPWYRGENQGFLRLKALVRAITISRTKAVVHLPPRVDKVHHLDFAPSERSAYEEAKVSTVKLLEDAISSGNQDRTTFNALQRLNVLRLICSHGVLSQTCQKLTNESRVGISEPQTPMAAESIVGDLDEPKYCPDCGMDILGGILEGSPSADLDASALRANGLRALCPHCNAQTSDETSLSIPSSRERIDQKYASAGDSASPMPMDCDSNQSTLDYMSTKIKALVEDLSKHGFQEKSVVFSYWTYTLDLIQLMLDDIGIQYTRIDGKTSLPRRAEALQNFHGDETLRVILVSITCGGAGLDLTAASRVYLMEPHWNPMIEEQALCRVHRVGQKRSVTTVRYLMRDSFEEQVVEIQKRKKLLAKVAFGQDPLPESGIGLGTLQYLKSVLE
ncbi:putative SWI/SNF-related matrix-associated actin-dependent regulator of chromatin subfamily A member 3-like 1 [Lachnellula arida]|uniref:Putative SWI/SNF-related matrix-associated actin-dependent regulator of chromatin subfamily A member 3-like 1 n=1 Tax=Lachnellula arida TaxID=1316785 RepID=A0A8T9BQQ1_9HELO|nr:putative SWI/SNF-related matrix-associated actin-dependent regulator of chromatin subfamily A member 3-like 1 [Lachnellula arida]